MLPRFRVAAKALQELAHLAAICSLTKASAQQFVYASSTTPTLQQGSECVGDTSNDPIGVTFDEIYRGSFHYVVWNDQFYGDPDISGCSESCGAPWGHSKGVVAWNDAGEGLVMQVTTPSPASGSSEFPTQDGWQYLGLRKGRRMSKSASISSLCG